MLYFPAEEIPIATGLDGTSVDLETGAVGELAGADANFFLGGDGIANDAYPTQTVATWQPVRIGTGNTDPVDNLTVGALVDAGSTFSAGFGGSDAHLGNTFSVGTPGYIGFSLETVAGTSYGWMRVTLTANTAGGVIHEWAYESVADTAIAVGAIPEPGVLLLGLGSLGALALRRKR